MEAITIRVDEDTKRMLAEEAHENDASMSETARNYIQRGMDYDDIERDRDRLRSQIRTLIEQRENHTELVRAVQREQTLAERRAGAGIATRVKWWVLGDSEVRED